MDVICPIDFIAASLMYTICGASLLHLLLIAWERYVATVKWMEYKAIVTRGRVNIYTRIAWLVALVTLKMIFAQVVETSVTNNSSSQNYPHPDDHTIRTTTEHIRFWRHSGGEIVRSSSPNKNPSASQTEECLEIQTSAHNF